MVLIECDAAFQKEVKYTAKEEQLILKALNHKDSITCSSKCEKSQFCIAYLINQQEAKSGVQTTGYECTLYYKDIKGLEKEVPSCKTGYVNRENSII